MLLSIVSILALTGPARHTAAFDPSSSPSPMVGARAPLLNIQKWIKGKPAPRWEKGHIYILDIWAVWCGPCVGGMPHLTQLQQKYQNRGVTVIGLTGPDNYGSTLEKAEALVARQGKAIGYTIAWDNRSQSYAAWMKLEKDRGWPWVFIVDRSGAIAFSGHPAGMDRPLEQIVAGTYDLPAATKAYAARIRAKELARLFRQARQNREWERALSTYDQIVRLDANVAAYHVSENFRILFLERNDPEGAYRFLQQAIESFLKDDPDTLSAITDLILDPKGGIEPKNMDVALQAALRADTLYHHTDAETLALLARVYFLKQDYAHAIATQSRAVRFAPQENRAAYRKTLDDYQKADPRRKTPGAQGSPALPRQPLCSLRFMCLRGLSPAR